MLPRYRSSGRITRPLRLLYRSSMPTNLPERPPGTCRGLVFGLATMLISGGLVVAGLMSAVSLLVSEFK
jgi:hypothetical protein